MANNHETPNTPNGQTRGAGGREPSSEPYHEGAVHGASADFIHPEQKRKRAAYLAEAARRFVAIYKQIQSSPDLSADIRPELQKEVIMVEQEAAKGEQAEVEFIEQRLENIRQMAPRVLREVLAVLVDPAAGYGAGVRRLAGRMRGEGGG